MFPKHVKSWPVALVVFVSLMFGGCAFKRLIYDRLDWFTMYQIDSYLDLSREQKIKFKPAVSEAIAWLKKEKVPTAITLIGKFEEGAKAHRYDETMNKAFTAELDRARIDLITKFERPIVEMLSSLSSDQLQHLRKKMKKGNEDLEEVLEEKTDKAIEDEYETILTKKQLKVVNEWYGDLDKAQTEYFYKTMRLNKAQIQSKLTERKRMQEFLANTLESRDPTKIRAMVETFRDKGEVWQDPAYLKYRQAGEERWDHYLKGLSASLSAEQWTHLGTKLKDMRLELEHMIGRE